MNRIKTILITLAALIADTSATWADEMSDLVAAVAASTIKEQIARDVAPVSLDNSKPRYLPKVTVTADLDINMLDGIISSMKREAFRRMRVEIYGEDTDGFVEDISGSAYTPFFRPVPGPVTSRFGWRPIFQRDHHGIDLGLHIGDTVRCAVSGTVEHIAYDHDGYGHYVVLSHPDGMETLYGHLQYPLVAQGQMVYAGQPVGIGGDTGNSTGPHLHFEVRLGGVAVDPLLIFDFYGINRYLYAIEEPSPVVFSPKAPTYTHQQKSLKHESTYIVRAGDTPESVARQAGISVMRLLQLNMLSATEPLPLGRMLKLR